MYVVLPGSSLYNFLEFLVLNHVNRATYKYYFKPFECVKYMMVVRMNLFNIAERALIRTTQSIKKEKKRSLTITLTASNNI